MFPIFYSDFFQNMKNSRLEQAKTAKEYPYFNANFHVIKIVSDYLLSINVKDGIMTPWHPLA